MTEKEIEDLIKRLEEAQETIKRQQDELDKAKKANDMKTMFVACMSHEIRTPLNAIEGFSRIVAETESSEENF